MKKVPAQFDRDLTAQLRFPTLSWSCMSSWYYAKKLNRPLDEWYNSYVLGIRGHSNATMLAGTWIGQKLCDDPNFLPEVPRPEIYEHDLVGKLGDINLRGHLDGWSPTTKQLLEFKTSTREDRWTQKEVDEWGQVTFYCLLLHLNYKILPEDIGIRLVAIPTDEHGDFEVRVSKHKKVKVFHTKRTTHDIIQFGREIKQVHKAMSEYVIHRQKLEGGV